MITIFSVPKPFCGHIGVIQRNALESWTRLFPHCEVFLLGDGQGIDEISASYMVRHIRDVAVNEYGTPLLNDVFEKAQAAARHELMCYVNADIILMSDFARAVEFMSTLKTAFLMAGRRWDIDLMQPLDFQRDTWDECLRRNVRQVGRPRPPEWIDYFVFVRGLFSDLPPFTIGRAGYDNWLLWKARSRGAKLVDASEVVMVVHQNHDYSHHPEGQRGVWEGAEAKKNRALMGSARRCFTLADATHRLTPTGIRRNVTPEYLRRRWEVTLMTLRLWTLPARQRLRLHRSHVGNLANVVRTIFSPVSERDAGGK